MKSKRGKSQAETILYLFFAVIFILVGILAVKSYLINAELNKDLQLSNLDFGVTSNRLLASDNCLSSSQIITLNDGEADYQINFVGIGETNKARVTDSVVNACLKGFDKSNYKINIYSLANDGERTIIGNSNGYGTLECESPPNRKGEFLIGLKGSPTGLGVFEICID